MFLISTLRNFANDLTLEQGRERYRAAIDGLTIERLSLTARDKAKTVLDPSREFLEVVSDEVLTAALATVQLQDLVEKIRLRASMISPVGEWGALGNYEYRHSRTGGNV